MSTIVDDPEYSMKPDFTQEAIAYRQAMLNSEAFEEVNNYIKAVVSLPMPLIDPELLGIAFSNATNNEAIVWGQEMAVMIRKLNAISRRVKQVAYDIETTVTITKTYESIEQGRGAELHNYGNALKIGDQKYLEKHTPRFVTNEEIIENANEEQ